MATFPLQIVSTLEPPTEREVVSIDVPAAKGRLTVMAGHVPLVCALVPGRVRIAGSDSRVEEWQLPTQGILTVARERTTLLSKEPLAAVDPESI